MHSTMITTALLFASAALAVPVKRTNGTATATTSSDSEVRVILQSQSVEEGSQTPFTGLSREQKRPVASRGPFETIAIRIGAGNPNQALRCSALDEAGKPLIAVRGPNTDITFADGGAAAPWTFQSPSIVSQIICDPAFVKISPEDLEKLLAGAPEDVADAPGEVADAPEQIDSDATEVRIVLQNQGSSLGTQTVFDSVTEREATRPVGSSGPFETVELRVGEQAQQNLRCQILDQAGKPIVVLRNGNRDITFADGDAGIWNFEQESEVSKIVCDPNFVKGSV